MPRARTAEEKQARREEILAAAVELLSVERYDDVTMASIARAARVGKGTPYLYWPTKEELFLSALQREYVAFLAELASAIRACEATIPAVARRTAAEVAARPRLLALLALLHAVLEHNARLEAVVAFKRALLEGGFEVAQALCERLPWLRLPAATALLLRLHGAMVAYRQMADPPPVVLAALEAPELALLRVDLEVELRELVHDLLVAARERVDG